MTMALKVFILPLLDCLRLAKLSRIRLQLWAPVKWAPGYLIDRFLLNNVVRDHHTRSCTNVPVKKYNLSLGQRKFANKVVKL